MLEIQRLGPDDGERLRALRLASLRDAPGAFASTYEETAARPPASWRQQLVELPTFVAVLDGADAGVVRAAPCAPPAKLPAEADAALLISMWVAPPARGRGVGEALVRAVIEWARAAGRVRLLLDVVDDNAPAIALYERLGFAPTGQASAFPPPREHVREHRRVLDLTPPA